MIGILPLSFLDGRRNETEKFPSIVVLTNLLKPTSHFFEGSRTPAIPTVVPQTVIKERAMYCPEVFFLDIFEYLPFHNLF